MPLSQKMSGVAALLSLGLLGACTAQDASPAAADGFTLVASNDFESTAGWSDNPSQSNAAALLDKGRAHSGQYAIKVDKDHEFSLTYDMMLGQMRARKFRTVRVEAWVFLPGVQGGAHLGLQVLGPDDQQQVFGDGIHLGDVVKTYGEWASVSQDFRLPDNITSAQHLRIFLWRAGATDTVLADDVRISLK